MITVFQGFSVLMFPAADIVDIKAVIAAPCVPAMGPVLLIAFRRPGASYYRSSAHRNKSYQVHPSPHKRIGYDSVGDIERGISTWKRADGDGEGLVPNQSRILYIMERHLRHEDNGRQEESSVIFTQIKGG